MSRSQYCFKVEPGEFRGVYTKPYTGFGRGGQAGTQMMVDLDDVEENIETYFEQHHQRYNLESYNVPHINDDPIDESKLPNDGEPVDDEGTAPAVKSAYRPKPIKSAIKQAPLKSKTFTETANEKAQFRMNKKVEGTRSKDYDPELEKIPHYMRERVAYLIDKVVEKRVRTFMDDFRQECF